MANPAGKPNPPRSGQEQSLFDASLAGKRKTRSDPNVQRPNVRLSASSPLAFLGLFVRLCGVRTEVWVSYSFQAHPTGLPIDLQPLLELLNAGDRRELAHLAADRYEIQSAFVARRAESAAFRLEQIERFLERNVPGLGP